MGLLQNHDESAVLLSWLNIIDFELFSRIISFLRTYFFQNVRNVLSLTDLFRLLYLSDLLNIIVNRVHYYLIWNMTTLVDWSFINFCSKISIITMNYITREIHKKSSVGQYTHFYSTVLIGYKRHLKYILTLMTPL